MAVRGTQHFPKPRTGASPLNAVSYYIQHTRCEVSLFNLVSVANSLSRQDGGDVEVLFLCKCFKSHSYYPIQV